MNIAELKEKLRDEQAENFNHTNFKFTEFVDVFSFKSGWNACRTENAKTITALLEIIEDMQLFLLYVAKTDISEKEPDFLWLNEWRNHRKQLAQNTLTATEQKLKKLTEDK